MVYWKYIYVSIIYTSITFIIYTEFLHTTAASTHLSCIYCSVRTFFLSSYLLCLLGINSFYFYLLPFTALHEKKTTFLLSGMLQYFWWMLQEDNPYDVLSVKSHLKNAMCRVPTLSLSLKIKSHSFKSSQYHFDFVIILIIYEMVLSKWHWVGVNSKFIQYDRLNEVLVYGIDYAILLSVPTFY